MNLVIAASILSFAGGVMLKGFESKYERAIKKVWEIKVNDSQSNSTTAEGKRNLLISLVRYGTLAPSSHNTQCWKFLIDSEANSIRIKPDLSRRCPIVDPDDHHLYATLGCALENVVIAAKACGLKAAVDMSQPTNGILVKFSSCEPEKSPLYDAILNRQCTRGLYDGTMVADEDLTSLKQAGTGNGVHVIFLTEKEKIKEVLHYITIANAMQIENQDFVTELKKWIRFSNADALKNCDGLFSNCMGSPSAPKWLGSLIFRMLFHPKEENAKVRKLVDSSAGIALFVSENNDAQHWIEAGRCYERFALRATTLGLKNSFLNMPVEEASVRPALAHSLGIKDGHRPDFVVRFGKGVAMPKSLRRPLEDVIEYTQSKETL